MILGHGNDNYRYDHEIVVDFSSNIAETHIKEQLLTFLQDRLKTISNYPDPEAGQLRKAIAGFHNVSAENVVVCNGATEAFYLMAQSFPQQRSLISIPSFREYEDACSRFGHDITFDTQVKTGDIKSSDMVWLGNPNNPDGKVTPFETIEEWSKQYPDTLFVIDEAFGEMSEGFKSAIPLVCTRRNLIIVRSLTKSFSVPGIRIGYLIAGKEITDKVREKLIPWNVNSMAIEAGLFIINNYNRLLPDISKLTNARKSFRNDLEHVNGIDVFDSACNFLLAKVKHGTAAELKQYLIKEHGMLIRDAANFRGLTPGHFRLAVRSDQQNQLLVSAVQEWINLQTTI